MSPVQHCLGQLPLTLSTVVFGDSQAPAEAATAAATTPASASTAASGPSTPATATYVDAAAELEQVKEDLAKSKNQERIAKKQIQTTFNPAKLTIAEWTKQRNAKEGRFKELEEKVKELEAKASNQAHLPLTAARSC